MAKSPDSDPVTSNIRRAKGEITEAESELDKVISAIDSLPRHEKVVISGGVNEAFERLRSAKERLEVLEQLLKKK